MQMRTSKTMIYGDEGWWKVADWDEGWLYSWGGAQPFQLEDPACGEQRPGALFAISNIIKMNNVYSLFQKMEAEVMENNQSFICLPKVLKPKLLNSEVLPIVSVLLSQEASNSRQEAIIDKDCSE